MCKHLLFSTTLFTSAFLLFSIQPLTGKILLPLVGSTPSVWNTCMVFFQAILLLGYSYVACINKINIKKQAILHTLIIALTFLYIPIQFNPTVFIYNKISEIWLMHFLFIAIGAPLLIVTTTAPLLQSWFAKTKNSNAQDPYFLYNASNIGSIAALICYPLLIEQYISLKNQSFIWGHIYIILAILISIILIQVLSQNISPNLSLNLPNTNKTTTPIITYSINLKQYLSWLMLSFVPSCLLLSITTYITTDIAPVPLLWLIPLILYLFSFIIAFAKKQYIKKSYVLATHVYAIALFILIYPFYTGPISTWESMPIHLMIFFISAIICHCALVNLRPHVSKLPEFYICIALGGFLGGVFTTFIAPKVFVSLYEYPLMLILACLCRAQYNQASNFFKNKYDVILPIYIGTIILFMSYLFAWQGSRSEILMVGYCLFFISIFYFGQPSSLRLALIFAVIILCKNIIYNHSHKNILYQERSFFGIHKVVANENNMHFLYNGNIVHGLQSFATNSLLPTAYYQPLKDIFTESDKNIAVVGLGAGILSCFARADQEVTFYEIDPLVVKIARDPNYFTYLQDCPPLGGIIIGDGRINLNKSIANKFDLIVLDAYSSDALPTHLITKEAIELYLNKINQNGLLAFNISNNYLKLDTVLATIAESLDLQIITKKDPGENGQYNYMSEWIILTRNQRSIERLTNQFNWENVKINHNNKIWTDDYSNIINILRLI